jgi:HEAT repeat protein
METEAHPMAEECVRLLAAAANAQRLYPPSSELPAQALEKFVSRVNNVTSTLGPLRYIIDPHTIRYGESDVGATSNQVGALADQLHAMQVGQLVIAPDLSTTEAHSFIGVINTEAATIRQQGVRDALSAAGVSRIAVITVTLRQSEEEGILGLDLATAPLEEVGNEALESANRWYESAGQGQGQDDMAEAIGRLEEATQDLASERIAQALMQLDEKSRMRVLAYSLRADASGSRMSGMLGVVARMNPASLARLLKIVASQANAEPGRLLGAMELPPEVAEQVMMLLRPSPLSEQEYGVPADMDVEQLAEEARDDTDRDDLDRQIAISAPSLASGKALSTTVAISRTNPSSEAVTAIGEALPAAAKDGEFIALREALRRLDEMARQAEYSMDVENARSRLADPEILADVCRAPLTDADAAIAGEILVAAGQPGAEVLIDTYIDADEHTRSLLTPVIRRMGEPLMQAASRKIRTQDSATAAAMLGMLPSLGDKRAVDVMSQGLEHLDVRVRMAAVRALADTPGEDGKTALAKSLGHWDPQTRRFVIQEIGRVQAHQATRGLVRILEDINVFERNHELKKEAIKSLESLGSPEAIPVLRRWANRKFVFGRKNKELRFLARQATLRLEDESRQRGVDAP